MRPPSVTTWGDFLRSRWAALSPARVGLVPGRRRRTPGLRRDEVAQLANYYLTGRVRFPCPQSYRPVATWPGRRRR